MRVQSGKYICIAALVSARQHWSEGMSIRLRVVALTQLELEAAHMHTLQYASLKFQS